jgi:hypothetical protein
MKRLVLERGRPASGGADLHSLNNNEGGTPCQASPGPATGYGVIILDSEFGVISDLLQERCGR